MENIDEYTFMYPDLMIEDEETLMNSPRVRLLAKAFENRRQKVSRNPVNRDRYGAHDRLLAAFFTDIPIYDERAFRKTYRMDRSLFNDIVTAVTAHDPYFNSNIDCTGREGVAPLVKCTSEIRQLAYGIVPAFLDEYLQISKRTSRESLDHLCSAIRATYGPEYLRKPTVSDVELLYQHHERNHGFPGMLGSLDCTDWEWFGCPYAHKWQYVRRDHGSNPFILLEAVVLEDLWTWHAFFGVSGSNNDINVLYQSPLFNDLKTGRAPEVPFMANSVNYPFGYYLTDGIYPELAPLVKTIPEPSNDDHNRILYKQKQESARKDVEHAFGVLKKKWAMIANPARALKKERLVNMMYACIIMHNMIHKHKEYAISPKWFRGEAQQADYLVRSTEEIHVVMGYIRSSQVHQNLRSDLI